MKACELLELIGDAQDEYILDAKAPVKRGRNAWLKWAAVAAVLCITTVGLISLFNHSESPFVLTAYALGEDDSLLSTKMEEGKSVAVSTFVAGNGMEGFVFSGKSRKSEKSPLVSIIGTDFSPYIMSDSFTSTSEEKIGEISHMDLEKTKQYIFFVPSQGEPAPYSLTISIYDDKTNTAARLSVVIEYKESGWTAKIDKIHSYEILDDIDELLTPYREVLDRLSREYGYKLYIPEDRKYSVYDAYKDLSPEEFEKRILEELRESEAAGDPDYDGAMNFDYSDTPSQNP